VALLLMGSKEAYLSTVNKKQVVLCFLATVKHGFSETVVGF
jgi:hypothetical protein